MLMGMKKRLPLLVLVLLLGALMAAVLTQRETAPEPAPAPEASAETTGPSVPTGPGAEETMVHVQKPAGDGVNFSHGSGVYLGDGLILTAAHVVEMDSTHPQVKILFYEQVIVPGEVVLNGRIFAPDLDLALIRIEPKDLTPRRRDETPTAICSTNPGTDSPMLVAAEGKVTTAKTIPTALERRDTASNNTNGWTNILSTGYHHGASGGGVFDPEMNCLEGVISLELSDPSRGIDLTSFVPASRIGPFLDYYSRHH
jgi:S1-C subfamily serine protease